MKIKKSNLKQAIGRVLESMVPDLTIASQGELYPELGDDDQQRAEEKTRLRHEIINSMMKIVWLSKKLKTRAKPWTMRELSAAYLSNVGNEPLEHFSPQELEELARLAIATAVLTPKKDQELEESSSSGDSSIPSEYMASMKTAIDMMSRLDWYYEYSDDPRVYRQGMKNDRDLREFVKTNLPQKIIDFLWQTYAPGEFKNFPPVSKV